MARAQKAEEVSGGVVGDGEGVDASSDWTSDSESGITSVVDCDGGASCGGEMVWRSGKSLDENPRVCACWRFRVFWWQLSKCAGA